MNEMASAFDPARLAVLRPAFEAACDDPALLLVSDADLLAAA